MSHEHRSLPPELHEELTQHADGAELAQVWDLLAIADPAAGVSAAAASATGTASDATWARIGAHVESGRRPRLTPLRGGTPASTPATVRAPRWRRTAGAALAATLLVALGLGTWAARPVTVSAPDGAQYTLTLPDGSVVELNAGSTLTYRGGLRSRLGVPMGTRAIALSGEAFFSVAHDPQRPFEVRTSTARVTVLGTRFLVRARPDEADGTRVAVESGRVRVASSDASGGAIELTAGQGTRVAERTAPTPAAAVGVERLTLWRRGGLAFVDQPLAAIVRELERRYAVEIRLRDVIASDDRITYYAGRPSIETVLSDLCTPRGLRFTRTSRGFEISPVVESGPATR